MRSLKSLDMIKGDIWKDYGVNSPHLGKLGLTENSSKYIPFLLVRIGPLVPRFGSLMFVPEVW